MRLASLGVYVSRIKMLISLLRSHGSRILDYIYGAIIFLFQDPSFKMNSLAGNSSSNVGGLLHIYKDKMKFFTNTKCKYITV